ncbi:hypothetical protein [Roseobacter sinensis]|uniref:Uncharacterized protein n=1 Tax=Roseobacter sinensis TaxID=2931391 RepID=A0ABT3BL21_9RHOB|nr:hypothetical protein [Roseobacter sp. WL0113]MCV3274266.1 hypothetical protein [Roseobacter sp. WL0113]
MVDIFSKKEGPRREDVAAKRIISENRQTIHRLADQISNGGFSRSRAAMAKAKEAPKPQGLSIHLLGGTGKAVDPEPVFKISLNGRVVIMDANSGKQLVFLGEMRRKDSQKYFALATKKNGFLSPLDDETQDRLRDLDGVILETGEIEDKFSDVMKDRLGL